MPKVPHKIDVHVGSRVRMRRMLIGMSQEKLGEQLGLTFQQVQKYEKGANRIGASRLYMISEVLGVPVQFFFEDMPTDAIGNTNLVENEVQSYDGITSLMDFVGSREGLSLNMAFTKIENIQTRRAIVDLCKAVSKKI